MLLATVLQHGLTAQLIAVFLPLTSVPNGQHDPACRRARSWHKALLQSLCKPCEVRGRLGIQEKQAILYSPTAALSLTCCRSIPHLISASLNH